MANRKPDLYDDNDRYYDDDLRNFKNKKLNLLDGLHVTTAGLLLLGGSKCHSKINEANIEFSGYMYINGRDNNYIQYDINEAKSAWIDWANQKIYIGSKTNVLELHFYRMKEEDFERLIIDLEA